MTLKINAIIHYNYPNLQVEWNWELTENDLGCAIYKEENGGRQKTENDKFLIVYNIKFEQVIDFGFVYFCAAKEL